MLFNHRTSQPASLRRATISGIGDRPGLPVSIHALLAESDTDNHTDNQDQNSFNPRPPCGERRIRIVPVGLMGKFQSTPSLRRATRLLSSFLSSTWFQSTPSLRRATCNTAALNRSGAVSIHALLAESDPGVTSTECPQPCFNPRPPCGERRHVTQGSGEGDGFNPRPPCGERLAGFYLLPFLHKFQSTPSLRRATVQATMSGRSVQVSIHALLAESDSQRSGIQRHQERFNPRPPCGERPFSILFRAVAALFQSTPSLRRATWSSFLAHINQCCFNPRPPCGERLEQGQKKWDWAQFQSTPSLRRATSRTPVPIKSTTFQSTPSLRRATDRAEAEAAGAIVSIHALLAESDYSL